MSLRSIFPTILTDISDEQISTFYSAHACHRDGVESLTVLIPSLKLTKDVCAALGWTIPDSLSLPYGSYFVDLDSIKTSQKRLYPKADNTNVYNFKGLYIVDNVITQYKEYSVVDTGTLNKRFDTDGTLLATHYEDNSAVSGWLGSSDTLTKMQNMGTVKCTVRRDANQQYLHLRLKDT